MPCRDDPSCFVLPRMDPCTADHLRTPGIDVCLVHYQRPDHYDSVCGTNQQVWSMPADKVAAIRASISDWTALPAVRAAMLAMTQISARAARLEVVRFVLQQKQAFIVHPELLHWCVWRAFASRYDFAMARTHAQLEGPQQWLAQNCSELRGDRSVEDVCRSIASK